MAYVRGLDRSQPMLLPECLEDYVGEDNPVRVIDAFVDGLELHEIGMDCKEEGSVGRDGYHPKALLKLFVYGYLHRIRSSRQLERSTKCNLEVIWLLGKLQPDHWTINEFRRRHSACFKAVLRNFNMLSLELGLFGAELIALDGTFIKAVNSKARNYTGAKLKKLIKRVDELITQYLKELEDSVDPGGEQDDSGGQRQATAEALEALKERRHEYLRLVEEAQNSTTGQVSLSDPDSRRLSKGSQNTVGYNAQIAVDSKHHLIVAGEVTQDGNDQRQLEPMSQSAQDELGAQQLKIVADGDYHNLSQIHRLEQRGMEVHSPPRAPRQSTQNYYPLSSFHHDGSRDHYVCPEGHHLTRHADATEGEVIYRIYYNTKACRNCPVRGACTKASYRKLHIHEHAEAGKKVALRMTRCPEVYARRQGIVEHVFGTIKWDWDQGALMTRGLEGARGEWMLSCLAYNFRRVLSLVGSRRLLQAMRS